MKDNIFIINGKDVGISEIEVEKDGNILVHDKSDKYGLSIIVQYDLDKLKSMNIGENKSIDFNEYVILENEETALIWPTKYYVKRISNNTFYLDYTFDNIENDVTYMNERNSFDIILKNIELKIMVNFDIM